jgi:hypothetical protein
LVIASFSAFQKSTKIAVLVSSRPQEAYTIYGHFKEKGRAVMTLPFFEKSYLPAFLFWFTVGSLS